MQETQKAVQSLGWEDPLEEEMATHSSILAWRIPWAEEPGGLHSPWGRKESDMTERLHFHFHFLWRKEVLLDWWVSAIGIFTLHPLRGRTIQWKPVSWCFLNKNKNVPKNINIFQHSL